MEKTVCFTVVSDATKLTVKSVQIDGKDAIQIGDVLTDENVGDIVDKIVASGNATGAVTPPALEPAPVANSAQGAVTEGVDINALPPTPPAPVANSAQGAVTEGVDINALPPTPPAPVDNFAQGAVTESGVVTEGGAKLTGKHGILKTQQSGKHVNFVLGGSHLTRKSSYNRRRRQSTTRKGRRSSRRRR